AATRGETFDASRPARGDLADLVEMGARGGAHGSLSSTGATPGGAPHSTTRWTGSVTPRRPANRRPAMLERFRLTDRVAVVTGAGRGIGAGSALAFAEAGADVAITARTEPQLEEVAEQVRAMGRRALVFPADVDDLDNLDRLVEATVKEFGRIDIVVNNAGGTMPGALLDTSVRD